MKYSKREKRAILGALKTDINLKQSLTKPHAITALLITLVLLLYTTLVYKPSSFLLGIFVAYLVFLVISLLQFTDSVFKRPHPAFWRLVKGTSIFYLLILIIVLFQDKNSVRKWLQYLDPSLGVPLPERSYATACELNYANIMNQMDIFVPAHIFGWYFKALMIRDYYLCWILSIMFEIMEYSFAHHLNNFNECWWDHWILDVLLCNAIGIHFGMKTCTSFNAKLYKWRGKVSDNSFDLLNWVSSADTFKKYVGLVTTVVIFLAAELNTFYLKYLLWISPEHWLNTARLVIHVFMGSVALREGYSYLSDKTCKNFGYQVWICIACVVIETLICIKFGKGEFANPAPIHIKLFWAFMITFLITFPIYRYYLKSSKIKIN